jgi:peroxiredoxin
MRTLPLSLLALLLLAAPVAAQVNPRDGGHLPPAPPTPSRAGASPRVHQPILGEVSIGERAPDFELDASNGGSSKLSELRGGWVMLVFADRWKGVSPLDSIDAQARQLHAHVVGVVHEKQQTLLTYRQHAPKGILAYADPTGEVSAMYGCYDGVADETTPAFFLVDRDGTVRLAVVGHSFPPDEMLDLLRLATESWE